MKKIFGVAITLIIILSTLLFALPVSADTFGYYFPIIIKDTSGVARTNVAVLTNVQGSALVSSNYVNSTATNTNMKLNSTGTVSDTSEPYMMGTTQVPVVIPNLPANGSVEYDLYTGYSPVQTSFPMIFGNSGFLTVNDNAGLEPANNFSIAVSGYLNTTAGASENIVSKTNALVANVDPTTAGKIDAIIPTHITMFTIAATETAGNDFSFSSSNWIGQIFTTTSTSPISQIEIWDDTYSATNTIISIYATSGGLPVGSPLATSDGGGSGGPASWVACTFSTPFSPATSTQYCAVLLGGNGCVGRNNSNPYAGGDAGYISPTGNPVNGHWAAFTGQDFCMKIDTTPIVSITGVTSGVGTLSLSETPTASGTLTLSWTPQGGSANSATITGAGSVPNTANNWIIDQNNVMPYVTSYVETVSGVEKLKFQPNTIVSGTTLVDRDGTQNGVITFGANSGITITYGGIVSQVTNGATAGGSGLSGFNVSPAGAPQSLLSNGSNLTGAYGNNSTIWGVVASFMGSVQTAGQIPPQSQLGFVYLGCVLVLMLVLIKNGVQSMFFIVILIIAALGFGAGVGILAGWVAIIATIIMIGLLYSFKQYG